MKIKTYFCFAILLALFTVKTSLAKNSKNDDRIHVVKESKQTWQKISVITKCPIKILKALNAAWPDSTYSRLPVGTKLYYLPEKDIEIAEKFFAQMSDLNPGTPYYANYLALTQARKFCITTAEENGTCISLQTILNVKFLPVRQLQPKKASSKK